VKVRAGMGVSRLKTTRSSDFVPFSEFLDLVFGEAEDLIDVFKSVRITTQ
jgi:hypothetical protein